MVIKFWRTKECRERGNSEIYDVKYTDKYDLISIAKRMVDRDGVACVEVVEKEGYYDEEVLYVYDGVEEYIF